MCEHRRRARRRVAADRRHFRCILDTLEWLPHWMRQTNRRNPLNDHHVQLFSELHSTAGSQAGGEDAGEALRPVDPEHRTATEVHRALFSDQ
ncbi:hypothetical protein OPAG_05685 [Rhodococcus opacus PD630]|nr:hypothetical protein OPAG_05685 [Rhodococcus opacus PD630]KXX61656.1 hypothetical protein AZG88_32640 [Rhodococcus sp. LB1]NDV05424.1 hypothetical protein [Rhodococcus sp. IEGM 248]RZK86307.1 MAG: hypothetical protein EOP26_00875 [Rhodococcus sp. (in: high G+C Gram-positive bacteria)]UDG94991.1 hypothetical protein K2Z90_005089 [Rhodococcus opacus PD630]